MEMIPPRIYRLDLFNTNDRRSDYNVSIGRCPKYISFIGQYLYSFIRAARTWLNLTILKMNSPLEIILYTLRRCVNLTLPPCCRCHCHSPTASAKTNTVRLRPNSSNKITGTKYVRLSSSKCRGRVRDAPGQPSLSMRRCRTDP